MLAVVSATASLSWSSTLHCQAQQEWQPHRQPVEQWQQTEPASQRSNDTASRSAGLRPVLSSTERVGAGVVLRWQSTAPRDGQVQTRPASREPQTQAVASYSASSQIAGQASYVHSQSANQLRPSSNERSTTYQHNPVVSVSSAPPVDNPLRYQNVPPREDGAVRTVAYQQEHQSYNDQRSPQWRATSMVQNQESIGPGQLPEFQDPQTAPNKAQSNPLSPFDTPNPAGNQFDDIPNDLRDFGKSDIDPKTVPSLDNFGDQDPAPQPPSEVTPAFPPQEKENRSPRDRESVDPPKPLDDLTKPNKIPPSLKGSTEDEESDDKDSKDEEESELDQLLKKAKKSSLPNCISQRDMLRAKPLTSISLDVSPKLSNGLESLKSDGDEKAAGKTRAEFEKKSMLRDWTDYKGDFLATGRMIDMRSDHIILDVGGGAERKIPRSQLSDVDTSYVAELWNLPFRCGTGFEPRVGRNFVESTVQWKASNACHNPLYFEQVQLERYGHEAGPVVQPLLSSAHFFLTIPLLPYKMGINPVNECQYPLGYIRPGNCAPYMIQPFPWSLRGGLAEAGAIVGAAAIIP